MSNLTLFKSPLSSTLPFLISIAEEFTEVLRKWQLQESSIVKILPERAFSLAVYPGDNIVAASGDKHGNLSIWNAVSNDLLELKPHTRPITCTAFDLSSVYTTSYDGSSRMLDITTGLSQELYVHPEEEPIHYIWYLFILLCFC